MNPIYEEHVLSQVVFSAHPGNIKVIIVDGRLAVENGKVISVDEKETVEMSVRRGKDLLKRLSH